MTKKDYIALAAALKAQRPTGDTELAYISRHQWYHDVMAVMEVLRADNPKFNRNTFTTACGITNVMDP